MWAGRDVFNPAGESCRITSADGVMLRGNVQGICHVDCPPVVQFQHKKGKSRAICIFSLPR